MRRFSPQLLIGIGLNLVSVGLALRTIAGPHSPWVALLPGTRLAGAGTGLFNLALVAVALGSIDPHQSGLVAGTNDTFRNVGINVGIAALGALMPAHAIFGSGSSAAFVTGFHHALDVTSAVAGTAGGAAYVLIGRGQPAQVDVDTEPAAVGGAALAEMGS